MSGQWPEQSIDVRRPRELGVQSSANSPLTKSPMKTYQALKAQIDKLEKQAQTLRKAEISKVVAQFKQTIAEYELTARDLGFDLALGKKAARGKPARSLRASTGAPKYRNPETGDTWTGRGRPPGWIASAKDRESFLIEGVPAATSASRAARKAGPAKRVAKKAAARGRRNAQQSAANA